MLVKLTVGNFLSFDTETEFTMIPSNKIRKKSDHVIDIKSTSLLKYAVFYGANASGKTNLIKTLSFIQYCVTRSIPINASTCFCKNKEENRTKPSTFEIQFSIGDAFYAYGFSIVLDTRKVTEEWLYQLYQNGSTRLLFEREKGKKPILGEKIKLSSQDDAKYATYTDDFDDGSNLLFLTFMNRSKKISSESKLSFFREIYSWFTKNLYIATPDTSLRNFEYYFDDTSISQITELIRLFDTGISEIEKVNLSVDELKKSLPPVVYEDVFDSIKQQYEESGTAGVRMIVRVDSGIFYIESTETAEPTITTISLRHNRSFYDFKYDEESDGTRRLFELIDMLLTQNDDCVYIVDELERSLHPKLTEKIIELFETIHKDKRIQLIFTTHESSIMDQELFRRDEIWFIERDANNNSNIYSLDRFKERYDKKLSKAYLEGRYGAIPVFRRFSFKED